MGNQRPVKKGFARDIQAARDRGEIPKRELTEAELKQEKKEWNEQRVRSLLMEAEELMEESAQITKDIDDYFNI